MHSGFCKIISHLRPELSLCPDWISAFAASRLVVHCGPSKSIYLQLDTGDQLHARAYSSLGTSSSSGSLAEPFCQARKPVALVRLAATSATKADSRVPPPAGSAVSSSEEDVLLLGLAQRYSNPDDVPERILQRIRNQLFGRPIRPGEQTGRRALARPLQGRMIADWYFMPPSELPGFHNEEREYELSKALNRRHRKGEADEGEEAAKGKGGKKK